MDVDDDYESDYLDLFGFMMFDSSRMGRSCHNRDFVGISA